MALINEQKVDPKEFPLIGIGEYFMRLGKPADAKHALEKVAGSPTATAIDKNNAKLLIKRVNETLRDKQSSKIDAGGITTLPVKDLSPLEGIEIPMGSQDYGRLVEDIRERGIQVPVVVNTNNKLICGRHRWKAAIEVGIEEIPCFILGVTNFEELKYYSIMDNLARRQLDIKERKALVTEILRLRKDHPVRGRRRGGPRKEKIDSPKKVLKAACEGEQLSNRQVAEVMGVSPKTVDKIEKDLTATKSAVRPKSTKSLKNYVREGFKKSIFWGRDEKADKEFADEVAKAVIEHIEFIRKEAKEGQKLTVAVNFEYKEN